MNKALLVASREYLENLRTKGFWIGILSFPVLLVIAVAVPAFIEKTKGARAYAVVDQSGWLLQAVDDRASYEDVRSLLAFVRDEARQGGRGFEKLPPALKQLAPMLKDASETQLVSMARALSAQGAALDPAALEGLSPELQATAAEQGAALLQWRLSLTEEEARRLGARLSTARYRRVEIPAEAAAAPEDWLRRELDAERVFAYFVVGADPVAGSDGSKYVSNNLTDDDLRDWFSDLATQEVSRRRFAAEGLSEDVARRIQEPLVFESRQVSGGEETQVAAKDFLRQWAPAGFVYMLWVAIFSTANMLLTNTIEEKSSRIIEVLLSSVSPLQLMIGKIAGIAATGVTLVLSWSACMLVVLKFLPRIMGAPGSMDLSFIVSDPVFLLSFVAYFVLGYLLYAAILVSIGAVCNSLKEAQSLMQPVMILLVAPMIAMIPVAKDPNGPLAKVLSYIPTFTPFTMMNRAAAPPTLLEYVLTTVLLIVSIVVATWMAAKVFRIGVLMTGKPPRIGEILRWIRTPVGSNPETLDRQAVEMRE